MDEFLTIATTVRRFEGEGTFGPSYAAATTEYGRVRYANRLVRTSSGDEVVATARATYLLNTDPIPVGSLVLVGDSDVERIVIAEERHDTGMADMPNHYTIDLT